MEAIILAGGFGTRLQDIVKDVPKPMADIGGRPFLSYVLDLLSSHGVHRVILSVGYKHEVIERFFGDRYGGMEIGYVVEQEPLGTGGALRQALGSCRGADIVVVNGDTFFNIDLRKMLEFHLRKHADITIALKSMETAGRYGSVVVGQDGRISGFREKTDQATGYINGGVYIVNRNIAGPLEGLGRSFSLERDLLAKNVERISAYAFISDAFFIDIGLPADYRKARETLPQAARERMS